MFRNEVMSEDAVIIEQAEAIWNKHRLATSLGPNSHVAWV